MLKKDERRYSEVTVPARRGIDRDMVGYCFASGWFAPVGLTRKFKNQRSLILAPGQHGIIKKFEIITELFGGDK